MASGVRRQADLRLEPATVNGRAGALVIDGDGNLVAVIAFTSDGTRLRTIDVIANPEKLQAIGAG